MNTDDPESPPVELTWHAAARRVDLPGDGTGLAIEVAGFPLALFLVDGTVHVLGDSCPHMGGSLGLGVVKDGEVTCPWHGWHFALSTGLNTDGLASRVPVYAARVTEAGEVEVALPPAAG